MNDAVVYRMYDREGRLLYVGCSVQWPVRLAHHAGTKAWWKDVRSVTIEQFADADAALAAEGRAQVDEHPVHNVVRNGRIPNIRERKAQRAAEVQRRRAAVEADLAARGVYLAWVGCANCAVTEQVEIPRGTPRDGFPCPRCGLRTRFEPFPRSKPVPRGQVAV